jgi:hypothetical protein
MESIVRINRLKHYKAPGIVGVMGNDWILYAGYFLVIALLIPWAQ